MPLPGAEIGIALSAIALGAMVAFEIRPPIAVAALAGAVTTVFVAMALVAAEVSALPAGWPRIAVRVGGSWIAAAGLLMLGWLARGI